MSDKKNNFEDNLNQLEELVSGLESDQFSLEESLKKYEAGVKLFKSCKDKLDKAEKKISVLSDSLKEENL